MDNYFSYGSNMNPSQMEARCNGARSLGRAYLPGAQVVMNERGVATIIEADADVWCWGVLWSVSVGDIRALDRYEGVESGFYSKARRSVYIDGSPLENVLIYLARDSALPGVYRSRLGYLEGIVEGAKAFDLPEYYIHTLESLAVGV